jgi:glycosyltransferase involved in cell wall biosynthesis
LLISAYNEEDCIAEKLENSLSLDYPCDLFDIIVVSDQSSDGTDDIVKGFADRGVELLRMEDRGGKTLGLNAGVAGSSGEYIVFSDANAMYRPDAIRALIAPFSDPDIGAVVGESTYAEVNSDAGESESMYWRYETTRSGRRCIDRWVRPCSRISSIHCKSSSRVTDAFMNLPLYRWRRSPGASKKNSNARCG